MKVIICYDISNDKLRYKLVRKLEKFAIRVQFSVFKANMTDCDIKEFNEYVDKLLCDGKYGSVQIYKTSDNYSNCCVEDLPEDFLII